MPQTENPARAAKLDADIDMVRASKTAADCSMGQVPREFSPTYPAHAALQRLINFRTVDWSN
jgi:hypothetical protein